MSELQTRGVSALEETVDALVAKSDGPLDAEWKALALVALGLRENVGRWNPPPNPTPMLQLVIGRLDEKSAIEWWNKAGPDIVAVADHLSRHQPPDAGTPPVELWRDGICRAVNLGDEVALSTFPWSAVAPFDTFRWLTETETLSPEGRDRLFLEFIARGRPHDQLSELLWWKCALLASENRRYDVLAVLMAQPPVFKEAEFAKTWALVLSLHPACRSLHGCLPPAAIQAWQKEPGHSAGSASNRILRLWLEFAPPEQRERLPLWRTERVRRALALGNAREALELFDEAAAADPEPGLATRLRSVLRTDTTLLREAATMELSAPARRMVRSIERKNGMAEQPKESERAAELRAWLLDGSACPVWVVPIETK
ncbi:MAG: hypothetical protein ACKO2G_06730 [Verrucomicrobiales bacterium]